MGVTTIGMIGLGGLFLLLALRMPVATTMMIVGFFGAAAMKIGRASCRERV